MVDRNEQIRQLSIKYNLTEEQVKNIVHSPFRFIIHKNKEINLTGTETEEEFNNKTHNYNIPYIGKLYSSFYKFLSIYKRNE